VGLITLLACTLRMLLSTLRMLHALCVIALAVLIGGSAVGLCSVFVKFGGFVVIAVSHVRFLKIQLPARDNTTDSRPFPDVTEWCGGDVSCSI
jgi:hypothetical protein